MLRSRGFKPAGSDLAERIVLKAQEMPQDQTITLGQWVKRLFAEFHLPRPAYVLACTLVIGFILGFNAPLDTTTDDADPTDVQFFLYADEGPL
ncbi:MAG: hypothetical protein ACREP8_08055 [Candidatus Binatia bacterium]